jgi:hypothetical protein
MVKEGKVASEEGAVGGEDLARAKGAIGQGDSFGFSEVGQ